MFGLFKCVWIYYAPYLHMTQPKACKKENADVKIQ